MKLNPLSLSLLVTFVIFPFFPSLSGNPLKERDQRLERFRHAELEMSAAVRDGKMTREEARENLSAIKARLWKDEGAKDRVHDRENSEYEFRQAERRIHEAMEKGEISHEEAREKRAGLQKERHTANRDREWERIKGKVEGAVREGKMSREEANEEYERIEHHMHRRDKVVQEEEERIEKRLHEIREALESGEVSHEEAQRKMRHAHEEMGMVIRGRHMEIELKAQEQRIANALESGVISKSQAKEKMTDVRQRLARQFRSEPGGDDHEARRRAEEREVQEEAHRIRMYRETERELRSAVESGRVSGDEAERELIALRKRMFAEESRREGEGRHSREGRGLEERRHHEEERELWEAVERGLDAAVRLGKLDEEEAREIWEDFRSEDEDHEEEAFEEGDFE